MNDLEKIRNATSAEKFQITKLNLHGLGLEKFPQEIFELKNLQTLFISSNSIHEIPEEIISLSHLSYLNIGFNKISKLPVTFGKLKCLKMLFLNNNEFKEFPMITSELSKLEVLSLSFNNIEMLPFEIKGFERLEKLYLESINIKKLPKHFVLLPNINILGLTGNALTNVPLEIVFRGIPALRNYFRSIDDADETYKVFEAKLLIVGEGNVGKTCIIEKLMNHNKDIQKINNSTEGIEIKPWYINTKKYSDFRINIWDFGGQEIYHSTHQFFLTKRSLYVLVWTARTDDNINCFDYWLNIIKLLSDNAPVLVVLNKIDERIKMIDEQSISSKFNNIILFHKVSALEGTGMIELKEILQKEIEKLPLIGDILPKAWVDVRSKLEKLGKNYITIKEYKQICSEYNLNGEEALFLSNYFHDLGVVLHFQDNEILKDMVFLKPQWATNAVYKITDTKQIQLDYGKFEYSNLSNIWIDYEEDNYKYLIELMRKFELCFKVKKIENKKNKSKLLKDTYPKIEYIIPELLSETKPNSVNKWDYEDNLNFEYLYDFMPTGIITRLIVRIHDMIQGTSYWKNGIIIQRIEKFKNARNKIDRIEKTEALIMSLPLERKIKIFIKGYEKPQLLAIIRREIEYIHKTLNSPSCKEMIPCRCEVCKSSVEKSLYNFSDLKIYLESNEDTIFCTKGKSKVKIATLLEGISRSINKQKELNQVNIHNCEVIITDSYNNKM